MGNEQGKLVAKAEKRALDANSNEIQAQKKPKIVENPLKLVDINDDCLQAIFEHLDLESLVNIAETDDHFTTAAKSVFSRRYRNKKYVMSTFLIGKSDYIAIEKSFAALLFRHFGEFISDLLVDCLSQHDKTSEKSILLYCSSFLVNLDLVYTTTNCFKTIEKPFEKVEKLAIVRGMLNQKMSQLNVWFPNLTSLELFNVKFLEPQTVEVHLPALKQLMIHNDQMTLQQSTIVELLRLNPQVEVLRWRQLTYDASLVRSISECLPLLEELELWSPEDRFSSFGNQKICFETVKKFTLNTFYHRAEFVENMPFRFKALRELILDGFNQFQDDLLNFVIENHDLTKLCLTPFIGDFDDLTLEDLHKIVDSLPKLVDLEFCGDLFSKHELIPFLTDSKMLQKVRLLFIDLPLCPHFRAELKTDWNIATYCVDVECMEEHAVHFAFELERKH